MMMCPVMILKGIINQISAKTKLLFPVVCSLCLLFLVHSYDTMKYQEVHADFCDIAYGYSSYSYSFDNPSLLLKTISILQSAETKPANPNPFEYSKHNEIHVTFYCYTESGQPCAIDPVICIYPDGTLCCDYHEAGLIKYYTLIDGELGYQMLFQLYEQGVEQKYSASWS